MNLFLVWLVLTQHNYLEIHPCYCINMHHPCCINSSLFLKLRSILLYGYAVMSNVM